MDKTKSLLTLLYIFVVDFVENGPTGRSREVFDELRTAYKNADPKYKKLLQPELDEAMTAAGKAPKAKALAYAALGNTIKDVVPEIHNDRAITAVQLEIFRALGLYLRSDSQAALAKLRKFALQVTGDPWVAQKLAPDEAALEQDSRKLSRVVKKMTGRDDTKLTVEEAQEHREKNPALYKEYLAHRKDYNQVYKDALSSFVRKSGNQFVKVADFEAFCKANNIETTLPKGLGPLMIDDLGRLYTPQGELIDGVPNATTFPTVEINKNFGKEGGGDWVALARRADGSPGPYFYTTAFKKQSREAKFGKVADFLPKLQSIRNKWFAQVKKFDDKDPRSVAAVILEILYEFSARVGSSGNAADGQDTFGISTLRVKHLFPQSNGDIVIRYLGKDAVKTVHKIMANDPDQKYLVKALNILIKGKKPSDPVFTSVNSSGRVVAVNAAFVNAYFHSCGAPKGVTVHKLRTAKGTHLAKQLIEEQLEKPDNKQPKTDAAALDLLKNMAMQVGKILNHVRRTPTGEQTVTPMTALKNYIDPSCVREYYDALGMRYPKSLESLLAS